MNFMKKILFVNILALLSFCNVFAQTDTEFWFCIPQVTWQHEGDVPRLVITATNEPAKVTIEMPLEERFETVVLDIPKNTSYIYDFDAYMQYKYDNNGKVDRGARKGYHQEDNFIESGLYGESCVITNKGIHIHSTADITAYLERGKRNNDDIWALKGKNAFGTSFIVPSQNTFRNYNFNGSSQTESNEPNAWNAIDIVAVEDCNVTVTLPALGLVIDDEGLGRFELDNTCEFSLRRGQTLNLQAASQAASKHLGGTIIESEGEIVVQWKDDSLYKRDGNDYSKGDDGCYDIIGDQLVRLDLAGKEYIVMRGQLGHNNNKGEFVYLMSTVDDQTDITAVSGDGDNIPVSSLTGMGSMTKILLNGGQVNNGKNYDVVHINATNPIVVMHMSGFGCEVGGAILPTIEGCTGSRSVSVCRSTNEGFFLNIMCKKEHIGNFTITTSYRSNNNLKYRYENKEIPADWFDSIPNTGWSYLKREHVRFEEDSDDFPVKENDVVKVSNSKGLFHLAIINGGHDSGCRYGYFSDFSSNSGSAVISGDDFESTFNNFCVGDSIQLKATGGLKYLWEYTYGDSLVNGPGATFIHPEQRKDSMPWVKPALGYNIYNVTITRLCYMGSDQDTTIEVQARGKPSTIPDFDIDIQPCSPSKVVLTNTTNEGRHKFDFFWTINDSAQTKSVKKNFDDTLTYYNNSAAKQTYTVTLEASMGSACPHTKSKTFSVCPSVDAILFTTDTTKLVKGCQPLEVKGLNLSTGAYSKLHIDYGDGDQKTIDNVTPEQLTNKFYELLPKHNYANTSKNDTAYWMKITVYNDDGCSDSDSLQVIVFGNVKAQYIINKSSDCSPLETKVTNISFGDQSKISYTWIGLDTTQHPSYLINDPFTLEYLNNSDSSQHRVIGLKAARINADGSQCVSEARPDTLTIYPAFTANFETLSPSSGTGCNPLTAIFLNTSSDRSAETHFKWTLGDGSSDRSNDTLIHTYSHFKPDPQEYTVTLEGENKYGCASTAEPALITVMPYLNPNFTINNASGCSPLDVTITNNTPSHANKDNHKWNIACDDSIKYTIVSGSLDSTAVLRFVNKTGEPKWVTITLTDIYVDLSSRDTCEKSFSQKIEIYPELEAKITADKEIVCDSTVITFSNQSRFKGSKKAPTDYMWYFGDNTTFHNTDTAKIAHCYQNNSGSTGTTPQSFTATLVASANGCTSSTTATVGVYPKVRAAFSNEIYTVCSPDTVALKNSSTGANRYIFSFDDGTDTVYRNTLGDVLYAISTDTPDEIAVKRVTLTAMNGECRDSISKNYYAYPVVAPRLSVSPDAGCGPVDVMVDRSTTTGASTYKIDFGDGVTDETGAGSVAHSFANKTGSDTTYTVRLTATNVLGCSAETSATVTVYPEIKAAFSYEKTTECSPMDVKMINNSLNGSKFTWSFGDGSAAEEKTTKADFNHLYANSSADGNSISTYDIKLLVVDANHSACRDSATRQIQVYPKVIAAFKTENDEGCSPLTTTFTNQSKGYKLTYIWDYAHDNKHSAESAVEHTHTFDNIEPSTHTYNIKLTVTDINGCTVDTTLPVKAYPHVTADFTYVKNEACTPYPVTFSYPAAALNGNKFAWDFGFDSNKAVKTNKNSFDFVFDNSAANTVKTYNINLVSTDTLTGCADTITKPIEVYPRLVPAFTQDTYEGCNPLPVKFTNKTTGLADYLWDFGDSQSSAETSPSHLFKHYELTDKTYNVVLKTSQTATGCVKTVDTTVTVYSYVLAKFGINETNEGANGITEILGGCTPFDVTITDSSRLTNKGTWSWNFGNDSTSTVRQPGSLVYTNEDNTYPLENKNYTIKLVVTNDHGCKHDTAQTITVYPRSVPDFGGNLTGCEPLTISFTDKSVVDSKSQYYWTFSDGSTIVDKPPFSKTFHNYDYTDSKKYTVNLKTTTEYNCTDEITKEIEVYAKPLAKFIPLMDRACPPFEAEFKNASIGNEPTFYWDFGNGSRTTTTDFANQKNEYQNYTDEPITIDVQLITESVYGCRDTMINPMITFPNISVDFEFDSAGCSPHTVEIKNLSTKTVDNHLWYFGEGSTSVAKEPTFTYYNTTDNDQTLTITYIGLSKYQCTDTIQKNVTVYISPNVDFVAHAPSQRYPDDTVYFENYTQDGPWYYEWEFGDGNKLKTDEKYFMYKYGKWAPNEDNNIFNVSLNVQTEHCRNKVTHEVEILPPHPKIEITNNSPSGCVPLTVQFKIKEEYCNTYMWSFEDGTTSTEPEPEHEFTEPGIYNVKLTVEGDGGSHYDYEIITVNELPEPDFTTTPKYVMLPDQPVQFFNSTRNGYTYIWDFGDGNYSTEINPYHQYTQEGFYDVKLIAISQAMCTDSIIKEQEVEVSGAGYIKFPNAFLPSEESPLDGTYPVPDDVDNVFHPVWHGVKKFEMWIFNRWGEQLFYSDDVNVGWNGKYGNNGTELGQDVYFWKAKGKFENNVPFKLAGDVTLIRR